MSTFPRVGPTRTESARRAAQGYDQRQRLPIHREISTHNVRGALPVAIIDGPYDAAALSRILARPPVSLGRGSCAARPSTACNHGTFIMGLLGARRDASIPGLCPDCRLLHVPLFVDENAPSASVVELANAVKVAVAAGGRLINLSLAILNDGSQNDPDLATALDYAGKNGAVVLVAAGNQGRPAMGQLLSHPVTIPVVAVDGTRHLLAESNFGPSISRRGVAAPGHKVLGYAPGGATTVMSGTSVATAIAAGTLAQLWSLRPNADGAAVRAAVASLAPRNGSTPPMLDPGLLLAALDRASPPPVGNGSFIERAMSSYVCLQGEMAMKNGIEELTLPTRSGGPTAMSGSEVIPAQGPGGCTCGAPGGVCSCGDNPAAQPRFIYALGTVDIDFPDQSISEELQSVARTHRIVQGPNEPLRDWCFRVLTNPDARYVARKVCWTLRVEHQPAYHLSLVDLFDLPDLISCLAHPEDDLTLIVGSSSLVPVEACPGVSAPVLVVDQLSVFKKNNLSAWIKPSGLKPLSKAKTKLPHLTATALFDRLVQGADNLGDTDDWRALNYLAVNYQPIYEQYALLRTEGWTLESIKVMKSRLSRERRIVDPVFSFRQIDTGAVHKYFVRVDVTHLFPMIANQLADYFDR
jgi:PatG C-terminal/Subtilase family